MKKTAIVVLVLVVVLLVTTGITKIEPDEIGVRTLNIGSVGIVPEDYKPGYHRAIWLLDTWNRFPSSVQRVRFAKEAASSAVWQGGELQLTSADGDRVVITAEVIFRIADGLAHKVLQDSGPGDRYKNVVRALAQDATRVSFGRLRTEQFYNEGSRDEARKEAVSLLQGRLRPRGIELVDVLVESIEFDPNYEGLIKQKKIADQQVELQKAKTKAAEEKGKVDKIKVETAVKVQTIEREGEAEITRLKTETELQMAALAGQAAKYATERKADGGLYDDQRKAEGTRLVKLAEAEGTQRLNSALCGEGGRNLVALEAAKSINLADVTFPSMGYEWFNPIEMAWRLGATKGPEVAESPSAPQ
jgi:regulator of protease activity HflC (stomatin/prohibitin superfamily)